MLSFARHQPIQLRSGLLIAGVLAGLLDSWYLTQDALILTTRGMFTLLIISTMSYMTLLTLYRIIRGLFKIGRKLPEDIRDYDERLLVKDVGLFGIIPFGGTLYAMSIVSTVNLIGFGVIIIIQGLSIFLGARLSQILKK